MRFLSAPWVGLLETGAWLRNAEHANACARYFAERVATVRGVQITGPVEANAVFLEASEKILDGMRARGWKFYTFIGGAARFMFSWDCDMSRIDMFHRDLAEVSASV